MAKEFTDFLKRMLKNYRSIENSIVNMEQELEMLNSILDPKAMNYTAYNSGGSDYNSQEEKMYNYMFKTKILQNELKTNRFYYGMVTKALEILSKEELMLVEECYIKNRSVKRVSVDMNYDESNVYKILNKAIQKMSYFCYGIKSY